MWPTKKMSTESLCVAFDMTFLNDKNHARLRSRGDVGRAQTRAFYGLTDNDNAL